MGRLEPKHWMLIAGFLTATAAVVGGLDHWADMTKPAVVAGLLGQLAVLLGSVFAGAPPNPNTTAASNPQRRENEPNAATTRTGTGILVFLLLAMTVPGCGKTAPNTTPRSPEGQAAIEGRAVIKAADAVLVGLDQAMDVTANPRLPTAVGLPVVKAIRQVGVEGQNLAAALRVIDAAKTATEQAAGAAKAQAALVTMRAMLASALSPITDPANKAQVNALLSGLIEALAKAQLIIDAVKGPEPAHPAVLLPGWLAA